MKPDVDVIVRGGVGRIVTPVRPITGESVEDGDLREVPSDSKNALGYCQWVEIEDRLYQPTTSTYKSLPSGVYTPEFSKDMSPCLKRQDLHTDELITSPGSTQDAVLKEIEKFWESGDDYRASGFGHRRGYLLYGIQGGGKSGVIHRASDYVVNSLSGLVLLSSGDPNILKSIMPSLRKIEPERPALCVFEDLDALIKTWGEARVLSWLDGEDQVDHVLNIATTNYPEELDPRITARPRRFDRVIRIDPPDRATRLKYFEHKLRAFMDINDLDIQKIVDACEGMSFAALAEVLVSVKCLGKGLDETLRSLKLMQKSRPSSTDGRGPMGFSAMKGD